MNMYCALCILFFVVEELKTELPIILHYCDADVRLCVCLCVGVSVNKISQKLFHQSTSFLGGAFPLTQG